MLTNIICMQILLIIFFLFITLLVEWSKSSDFLTLEGESTMEELNNLQYEITNLDKDSLYYVQVCARNMKGYGAYSATNPSCAQPSSKYNKFNFSQRNVFTFIQNVQFSIYL